MQILDTVENYERARVASTFFLVQFGTERCAPCHAIQNKLDIWLKDHSTVQSVYIPLEQFPALAAEECIFSAPTLLFFVEGKLALRESGYFSLEEFLEKAQRYIEMI